MIVMKFGGSSLESAAAIERVASIVRIYTDRQPVVVVSAMGKTTDRLLGIARSCAAGKQDAARREFVHLRDFHFRESACLLGPEQCRLIDETISLHFAELEGVLQRVVCAGELTPRLSDAVLSFGERLSSQIVETAFRRAGIDSTHLDSRTAIVTDDRYTCGTLLEVETNALLRRRISHQQVTVMGGFIGATEQGVPTTLGRGGSDYTAAIVGAAICADEIQIWTDVDGMLTCDPRLVPEARPLESLSYSEAAEMAKAGAKVLHPATVLPAVKQSIPVVIRNSRNPAAAGTRIAEESLSPEGAMLSIACKTGITLLHLRPRTTPVTSELGRAIWDVFRRANVNFELISPAVKEFSLAVEHASLTAAFVNELNELAELNIEDGRALITMIGRNTSLNPSNLACASRTLEQLGTGAILTCCTDSRFAFVVPADSLRAAVSELHRLFFSLPASVPHLPGRSSTGAPEKSPSGAAVQALNGVLTPALS